MVRSQAVRTLLYKELGVFVWLFCTYLFSSLCYAIGSELSVTVRFIFPFIVIQTIHLVGAALVDPGQRNISYLLLTQTQRL